jgi:hypothetical protein
MQGGVLAVVGGFEVTGVGLGDDFVPDFPAEERAAGASGRTRRSLALAQVVPLRMARQFGQVAGQREGSLTRPDD